MRTPLQTNLLQNPNFAGGSSTGWILQSGWTINPGLAWDGSSIYMGVLTLVGTAAIVNTTKISCQAGGNVTARCWAFGALGATGYAVLRITFFDSSDIQIGINNDSGHPIPNTYVWTYTTFHKTAPLNAAYAIVDFAVYDSLGTGSWAVAEFFATYNLGVVTANPITYKLPLSYYLNLFTSQYRLSPKLNKWQAALMQPIDDLTNCYQQMNISYDIDNAYGSQLNVIGEIVGAKRTVPFQPSGGVSPVLDDDTYRTLLYATQAMDLWDGKTASIYPIWQFLYPGARLVINDNQNMTATIIFSGPLSSIEQDLIANGMIIPRPETVLYGASATTNILFGFDLNNSTIAGFDTGKFA